MTNYYDRLTELLASQGIHPIKLSWLADHTGASISTVSRWCSGEMPSETYNYRLRKLCQKVVKGLLENAPSGSQRRESSHESRTCLRCRNPFPSRWLGNRICSNCQQINTHDAVAWKSWGTMVCKRKIFPG